jgi:predicted nucleic acid-binding protein
VVFVDTSALFAALDEEDLHHQSAVAYWQAAIENLEIHTTTNYVILETTALLQRRLGLESVRNLTEQLLPALSVHWVTPEEHELALTTLLVANRRPLSLVDCSSFVVMRAARIRKAFAFDEHFREQGFETNLA